MDNQNQVGFGWLWTPSSGGNGILFCPPEHPHHPQGQPPSSSAVATPTPVLSIDGSRVSKIVLDNECQQQHNHHQNPLPCPGGGPVNMSPLNFEMIPIPKSHSEVTTPSVSSASTTPPHPPSSSSSSESVTGEGLFPHGIRGSGSAASIISSKRVSSKRRTNDLKLQIMSKPVMDEDELARRREINRLRERRRREQMSPKERAKARKKNRLRARKRRRNMTLEEREEEKERNRERARQRRLQKLQQEAEQQQQQP